MCRLIDGVVEEAETGRIPSLSNLRVDVGGTVEVSIDALEDCSVDLVIACLKGVMEYDLQIRVVGEVLVDIGLSRGSCAIKHDVLLGESG